MPTDYSKQKVDELTVLLKARSLPVSGKKADLVARLQQYDTEHASSAEPPTAAAPAAEDEIDWEDDAAAAATDAGAAAIAAGGLTQPPNPTAVPNQVVDTDPGKTSDLKVDPPVPEASTDAKATEPPAQDFSSHVPASIIDSELEKRKKRAARFGITESNDDALKALERAKKFGTGTTEDKSAVKGLDEALPERRPKRGRGGEERDGGREGKRSRVRGEHDGGPRRGGGGGRGGAGLSQKDREAAEARRKRFAAA